MRRWPVPFENGSAPEYTRSDAPLKHSDNLADMYRGVLCEDDVRGNLQLIPCSARFKVI